MYSWSEIPTDNECVIIKRVDLEDVGQTVIMIQTFEDRYKSKHESTHVTSVPMVDNYSDYEVKKIKAKKPQALKANTNTIKVPSK